MGEQNCSPFHQPHTLQHRELPAQVSSPSYPFGYKFYTYGGPEKLEWVHIVHHSMVQSPGLHLHSKWCPTNFAQYHTQYLLTLSAFLLESMYLSMFYLFFNHFHNHNLCFFSCSHQGVSLLVLNHVRDTLTDLLPIFRYCRNPYFVSTSRLRSPPFLPTHS